MHALIDWRFAPVFLETELQQIAPREQQGARAVDKLVKVRLLTGAEEWLFIHIEIQAQADRDFPARMWAYFCGTFHKFQQRVISLAVLADEQPGWRPDRFGYSLCGCTITLQPSDLTGDPGLDAFTDNDRPGNGHFPLLPTSQAIDTGNDAVCPRRDQLGQRRINIRGVGTSICDIGAIEFHPHDEAPVEESE